jgi:hypothetical protein
MTGYETFGIYEALKLHFTKDSYDFFKYNGKTNISVTAFENRKDKYHFYKLSRKLPNREDLIDFIVANLIKNETLWVGDLLNDDAVVTLTYIFENDCKKVFDGVEDPNDVIKVNDGSYPVLLTQMLQKNIEFETVCVLSKILGFLSMWQKKITDDIRWPTVHRKLTKYAAFLPQDVVKYKLILKRVIND